MPGVYGNWRGTACEILSVYEPLCHGTLSEGEDALDAKVEICPLRPDFS